jgi:hypothetical protein
MTAGLHKTGQGDAATSAGVTIGDLITSATSGSVLFAGASGALSQDNANFFWDDSNNRLGIGTATPAVDISVKPDTDGAAIFGRARVDARVTDTAYLSHVDGTTTADGYVAFAANGGVTINAKSGRSVGLSVNGTSILSITGTAVNYGVTLALGTNYVELSEMTAPAAPAANKARLYCVDNGAGKTQLAVIFPSGAAQILATEP